MDELQAKKTQMMFGTGNLNIQGRWGDLWRDRRLSISFKISMAKEKEKEKKKKVSELSLGFVDN